MLLDKAWKSRNLFHDHGRQVCIRKTALHYAAKQGNWQVVRYVLDILNRNDMGKYANSCDALTQTSLYLAVSKERVKVVKLLLREAEVNIVTWERISALGIAKKNEEEQNENQKIDALWTCWRATM